MKALNLKHFLSSSFLLAAIMVCGTLAAKAQTATTTTTTKPAAAKTTAAPATKGAASYIETFFKKYKMSSDSAIDYIFGTNKLFTNQAQINLLKSKLDSLQISFGKYMGRELIAQKNASNSLVIYSYLVKHENQPIRFIFMFYKPQHDWELYRFNYDDAMDMELMEAVKINNKKP